VPQGRAKVWDREELAGLARGGADFSPIGLCPW
jgi:hypothetical protein